MTPRRRGLSTLIAAGVAAALAGSTVTVLSHQASATESSAVTKAGDEAFPGLKVTVSKTKELRDEVVRVSWTGAAPTEPASGATGFRRNFMQIMQCWGDDQAGPKPEQCTFGAIAPVEADPALGSAVATRQVHGTLLPKDDADPHLADPADPEQRAYVPFDPVDGDPVGGTFRDFSVYFDYGGTNELPTARTRIDGTGEEIFNVQTAAEAPGLGCGRAVTLAGKTGPRGCWLVVVPRSNREVDGTTRLDNVGTPPEQLLQTSPLSASNWEHRIQFPLAFRPIPEPCALGSNSTITLGHDNITDAFTNWQPVLCTQAKAVFDYNEVPDGIARTKLAGPNPSLSIFGAPPAADAVPTDAVIAPIAISGLVFAYSWNVQAVPNDPENVRALGGARMPDGLKLTPRLVLKLLTQSYQLSSPDPPHLAGNPRRIEDDPEFQELNRNLFGDLGIKDVNRRSTNNVVSILTTINPSDVSRTLWTWIAADAEARSFLAGEDDGHGMRINPDFKGMDPNRDEFPKLDTTCRKGDPNLTPVPSDLCSLDLFPYAASLADAAKSAVRGDTLVRTVWDGTAVPPAYKKDAPQQRGKRAMMALTDTANATRYDLRVAALRNANGKFVRPTAGSMLAAVNAWKKGSVPGTLAPNPMAAGDGVYPLTTISYAAVRPAGSPDATPTENAVARKACAAFLSYAIGPGQKSGEAFGQLPPGYVPLPASLVKIGTAAVKAIKNYRAPATATPKPTPKPGKGSGTSGDGTSGGDSSGGSSTPGRGSTPTPTAGDPPAGQIPPSTDPALTGPTPTPSVPTVTTAITPTSGVGSRARFSLIWVLIAGLAAGLAARALPRIVVARARPNPARSQRPGPPPSGPSGPEGAPSGGDAGT